MNKLFIYVSVIIAFIAVEANINVFAYQTTEDPNVYMVANATITRIFQWDDGTIFIEFDQSFLSNCPCDGRAGFLKSSDEKAFLAMALSALANKSKVFARARKDNNACPMHQNSLRLVGLGVYAP